MPDPRLQRNRPADGAAPGIPGLPQAISRAACWRDWHREDITPHDGLVRADHPADAGHSGADPIGQLPSQLLRNPLGFVWRYGLRWRTPESGEDPLVLDALGMGDLVHLTLEHALARRSRPMAGFPQRRRNDIAAAVIGAAAESPRLWETERAVPPRVIWRRTLDEVARL